MDNTTAPHKPEEKQVKLVDVPISNMHDALQVMVAFLNLAQKRGTYSIDECAKIWECIKMFQNPPQPTTEDSSSSSSSSN